MTVDDLMITADQAMYASKRQGKNRVAGYSGPTGEPTPAAGEDEGSKRARKRGGGKPERAGSGRPGVGDRPSVGVMVVPEDERKSV